MKRVITVAFAMLAVSAIAFSQAAPQAAPQPTTPEIEKALLPAPRNMKDGATVIKWKADFTYETLRKGTNRLVCYDRPVQAGQDRGGRGSRVRAVRPRFVPERSRRAIRALRRLPRDLRSTQNAGPMNIRRAIESDETVLREPRDAAGDGGLAHADGVGELPDGQAARTVERREQRKGARGHGHSAGGDEPRGLALQPFAEALEARAEGEVAQLLHDVVDHVGILSIA